MCYLIRCCNYTLRKIIKLGWYRRRCRPGINHAPPLDWMEYGTLTEIQRSEHIITFLRWAFFWNQFNQSVWQAGLRFDSPCRAEKALLLPWLVVDTINYSRSRVFTGIENLSLIHRFSTLLGRPSPRHPSVNPWQRPGQTGLSLTLSVVHHCISPFWVCPILDSKAQLSAVLVNSL